MSFSRVNNQMTYSSTQWLVSLLNSGAKTGGHAMIVVEGIEDDGTNFVGQYDMAEYSLKKPESMGEVFQNAIGNDLGYINKIRVIEGKESTYPKPYSELSSRTWTALKGDVNNMINHIKQMRQDIINAKAQGQQSPFFYQKAGSSRNSLLGGNEGDNCVTWAENQILLAHINKNILETNTEILDSIKALPEAHTLGCTIL